MSRGFEIKITEEVIARQRAEAQTIIRALLAQVASFRKQVVVLTRRVAELEERLGKSPQNSSLPPSTQHPHAEPPADKRKSKRTCGGQPGHPGHERALIQVEEGPCAEMKSCREIRQHWRVGEF
jgi:hypothetical protein